MKCRLCPKPATSKHHISYFPEETTMVCEGCHKDIHTKPGFEKYLKFAPGDPKKYYSQKNRLRKWGIR